MSAATLVLVAAFGGRSAFAADALYIDNTGNVGLGTNTPDSILDLEFAGPRFRMTNVGPAGGVWDIIMNANTGRLVWTDDPTNARIPFKFDPGSQNNLIRVGVTAPDTVNIDGNLVVTGTITPDYVFSSEHELESIEEHAKFMWTNRHLPAVEAARVDESGKGVINIGARSQGVLEELEKAHIYIDQVNRQVKQLVSLNEAQQEQIRELREYKQSQGEALRHLEERLAALEASSAAD